MYLCPLPVLDKRSDHVRSTKYNFRWHAGRRGRDGTCIVLGHNSVVMGTCLQ